MSSRENRKKVREILTALYTAVWAEEWKGGAGLTARSVYIALLRVAYHHGDLVPAGLRVPISMRQLTLQAGVSLPTLNQAIKRLTYEHGLIRRDGRGEGPKSGAFVLLTGVRTTQTLSQGFHQGKEACSSLPECLSSARVALRWGAGRLGKTNEMVLDALRCLGGRAALGELAEATGRRARDLKRRQLSVLIERNLVVEERESFYALHPDFGWHLEFERALFSDEQEAEERDRRRYREQRERFRESWDRERSQVESLGRRTR